MKDLPFLLMCCLLLFWASCTMPAQNKADYLQQYAEFVEQLEEKEEISSSDWEKYDKQHLLYQKTYYKQFKSEMTWSEKLQAKAYGANYWAMKNLFSSPPAKKK